MVTFTRLDNTNMKIYEPLAMPMTIRFLDKLGEKEHAAVGAEVEGHPAGLLIAGAVPSFDAPGTFEMDRWEIRQVYVPPQYRRKGVGSGLLKTLEELLRNRSVENISIAYALEEDRRKGVDAFITGCGWQAPATESYMYRISKAQINSRWICTGGQEVRKYRLPQGVTISDFTTMTEAEREYIERGRNNWYRAFLSPFADYDSACHENSLLLRVNGEIAGWIYAMKYGLKTVFYRNIFVKEEYRPYAYGIYLLAEAINIQLGNGDDSAMFAVNTKNSPMLRLMDYVMGGDYDYVWETRIARKEL